MKEALKLALDALKESWHLTPKPDYVRAAITAIKAALAQLAQQEPVAVVKTLGGHPDESRHEAKWLVPYRALKDGDNLYTTPPQRPWVGLTDDERLEAAGIEGADEWFWKVVEAIEAKLKEKNT